MVEYNGTQVLVVVRLIVRSMGAIEVPGSGQQFQGCNAGVSGSREVPMKAPHQVHGDGEMAIISVSKTVVLGSNPGRHAKLTTKQYGTVV